MAIRTHTAPAGPAVLDLTQYTGRITIRVDQAAVRAGITVRVDAESGPAAEAVRGTGIEQSGQRITVTVPEASGTAGSGGGITVGGGRVIIGGVDVTGGFGAGAPAEIETAVALPPGSWVRLTTRTATTTASGALESLDYSGTSGHLVADEVGDLALTLTSGRVTVAHVTRRLDATLTSGHVGVHAYDGGDARLTLTSGHAHIAATPASRGRFSIGLTSGHATLTGARHLDVTRRVTGGHLTVS
ncbi:hypothetical protein [Kitasatospora sp. NPDC059327]|uniref:hypothetical protein n=1 Tax=Kitasatospora sp. NPDC059327 TaxID=3346803 RepID=UPI0036957C32